MSNQDIFRSARHLKPALFYRAGRPAVLCLFLGCLCGLVLAGCWRGPDSPGAVRAITIAGSTSVQPFAEKLAEEYMRRHSEVRIDIQGGGSSAGIYAAQQGVADLGASSRELVKAEKELMEIPIAYDGIAIIVNKDNPLENLSLEQIRQIYQGKITDWAELGLPSHSIHLITREEGSGTRNAFEELAMGKEAYITPAALVQDSNGSVREIVANDPHALGYISMGLVEPRVRAIAVDGVLPTRENVKNHSYKLVRRFLLVTQELKPGPCQDFVNFILSPKGQSLLETEGLVGVAD
ncbi:MAG: phosphate ABC transporter substrate-binding protein [Deltaproteobacteria bacterium]|nr:phosphate ABC transporter substrate-binding protein [Deltaproteobacteria bacterium]